MFERRFRNKTGNAWTERTHFQRAEGKYELVEIDYTAKSEDRLEPLVMTLNAKGEDVEFMPSKLPKESQRLMELLFERDMCFDAMKQFDIDVQKMPLGALSTKQIQKGVGVLMDIENHLTSSFHSRTQLEQLSSKFYTTLPHDFGRRRPPVVGTGDMVQRLYNMCDVLMDMRKATTLMAEAKENNKDDTMLKS